MKLYTKTENNNWNHAASKKITLWYAVNLEIAEKSNFDRKKKKTWQIWWILTNWSPNFMLISQKLQKIFCFKKLNHKRWVMDKPVSFGQKVMTSAKLMRNKGWKVCFRVSLSLCILALNLVTKAQVEQILGRRMGVESTPSSTY